MLMSEHPHKQVYNTTSAPLYPVACLSGAAACSPQRSAPRLEKSDIHLTWHAQLKILILNMMMGQGEHDLEYSSPW